ncbi:hypothetical protein Nepgr_026362 [Nepenthes gracilis]|uniref:Ras-related protein Rab-7b n=1 Tax=Nepenthes gracilis TaxID=150966 RepID=A0AAD3T8B5_NEPGR|nr:hypothetical protein Nepgr_026362 [Nepenthes gracilis]
MDMLLQKTLLKVIVLGDVGVGKTSLINRYIHKKFSHQYKATIGADFATKELQLKDKLVNLQVMGHGGQERFQSLGSAFFRGADCCMLVYDVSLLKSFESLLYWRQEFIKQTDIPDPENFPFVVIGNKIDIDGGANRTVAQRMAKEWCESNGRVPYFETSAKEDINIDVVFLSAATAALSRERVQDIYYDSIASSISGIEQRGGCACYN